MLKFKCAIGFFILTVNVEDIIILILLVGFMLHTIVCVVAAISAISFISVSFNCLIIASIGVFVTLRFVVLVDFFIERACSRLSRERPLLDPRTLYALYHSPWPGNVRQLENEVDRLVALSSEVILPEIISTSVLSQKPGEQREPLRGTLRELVAEATESLERQVISATLEQNEWNKSKTARLLGVSRPTLDQKIEKYRILREEEKGEE